MMSPEIEPMILLKNANVIVQTDPHRQAEALLISGPRIIASGTESECKSLVTGAITAIDLHGDTVIPGLIDAHIHLEKYARSITQLTCDSDSLEDCLQRIAEYSADHLSDEWILGHGWDQNEWSRYGSAADLDPYSSGRLVYLTAKSLHAAWVNTAALEIAGITASTPDPDDGIIDRLADGTPTGILFEGAMQLVADRIPTPTVSKVAETIHTAQQELHRFGITGVHDYDGPRCFSALQYLQKSQLLKLRVVKNIPVEYLPQAIDLGLQTGFGDEWLQVGNVKIFADGALGPRTAALIEPYEGEPSNRGVLLKDREEILEVGIRAVQNGLGLTVHAIGDQANHEILMGLKDLRELERSQNLPALSHRIEHAQILHPDDLSLFVENDIIASMQPIHATSDMEMADRYWGSRCQSAYAWRSLSELGVELFFGSDAPVESPNPFWGLHAAVSRRRTDGSPGVNGWYPEERLDLSTALCGFTANPAKAFSPKARIGRLLPGYHADLVVLDVDPFEVEPQALHQIIPRGVMVAGQWQIEDLESS